MAPTASFLPGFRSRLCFSLVLISSLVFVVAANGQTAIYRLHQETSSGSILQLRTANPDVSITAVQSSNLKNLATGEYIVKAFDSLSGVPNSPGVIVAGSSVTLTLWMKKTATAGTMFPRAKLKLNSDGGTSICVVTGTTALTTTLTKYTLNGTVSANVSMAASDRFYLWVGVNLTATTGVNNKGELDIEGTLNGNYDSLITVPLPTPPSSISNLSPTSGSVGTAVTISGANFGTTQGTSTVTFNGVTATPTNWADTSITVPVPAGAATGPVVVTARGSASNGVTFTVPTTGTIAGTVTRTSDSAALNGALVVALQAGVVKASATTAANGSYSMTSVLTGTYDVRASAVGYQTKIQNGVAVTSNTTTTVNQNLDAVTSGDINYVYDELGRLGSVVSPTETVTYTYDSVGNLLSISRSNSNLPSITGFTPNSGAVGAPVTIYGTAFSSTPGLNTVNFNGVTASVVSASTTQIVTSVPAGATTGTISVNTPTGLATSSAPFTVSTSTAPTITNFTPTIGTALTALTITGTNFDTTISNDWVTFNNRYALVSSATITEISTAVPALATSGRISVSTPAGSATSAADFFVPPGSAAVGDVQVTGRMNFGDSQTVTISTANKIGLILFDATALQRASLKVNSFSMTNCMVRFYNPDGSHLIATTFLATGGLLDTPLLPVTGTYTILIDPSGSNTGSINFTLYDATDATGTITPGGPPVTVTTTTPGQNVRLNFLATAGQRVSLQFSNSTFAGCIGVYDAIQAADGSTLASANFCTATGFIDTVTLAGGGYYTLLVDPQGATTGSQTVVLHNVPADVTGSITPGGSPVSITTTVPGQNAVLTFSGTAGQRVSLLISGSTFPGCIAVTNTIKKPDGTNLISSNLCSPSDFMETVTLPVTGTYSILVNPVGTAVGSETLLLYDVPADATASMTPGGAPVTLTTTVPGQNGVATFSGTANQRVSINVTGVSITGGSPQNWVTVSIKKPDGTTLGSGLFGSAGGFIDLQTLPVAGTYSVLADFWGTATGTVTLTLYDVPADVSTSITPGGAPVTITNTTPGQNGLATFSGTANQRVSLNISGVSLTGGYNNWVTVSIKRPDGTTLASKVVGNAGDYIEVQTLPVTGTYTVLADFSDTTTGSATLTLYDVPADISVSITPGGAPVTITNTTPGQNGLATFSGTTGQKVSLNITGVSGYNNWVTVAIKKPDGSTLVSGTYGSGGGFIGTQTLPTTGTYTILVDPWDTAVGSATLTLNNVP